MLDGPVTKPWTLSRGQLASMFGESEPTFTKRLPLRLTAGFPGRLPGSNKWSRPAVEEWFRTAGLPTATVTIVPVDEAGEELRRQYA